MFKKNRTIKTSYICRMTPFSSAQLYISETRIICQNSNHTFFDIEIADITGTKITSAGIVFALRDHAESVIHPQSDSRRFEAKLLFYHKGFFSAAVQARMEEALGQVGLAPQEDKKVSSRHRRIQGLLRTRPQI